MHSDFSMFEIISYRMDELKISVLPRISLNNITILGYCITAFLI